MGMQSFSNSVIKSIQRGTVTVTAANTAATNVTISVVDPTKSFIDVKMVPVAGNGGAYDALAAGTLTNSTTLALSAFSQTSASYTLFWQIVEYV